MKGNSRDSSKIMATDAVMGNNFAYVCLSEEIYYTDFTNRYLIPLPETIISPVLFGFMEEGRVSFYDLGTAENLIAPGYSINLDGSNLTEARGKYLGF